MQNEKSMPLPYFQISIIRRLLGKHIHRSSGGLGQELSPGIFKHTGPPSAVQLFLERKLSF
jgi:hypothetical protein